MANGRVQVQGVGSAPKLQAVVNAGGQYRVQTQQAGENKLQKLAGALSQVNPILKEYAAIQDIDAEMYRDEGKRLSPEDVEKRLKQNRDDLDKQWRRGGIPFFGSPHNWKRKARADGALLHDEFQQLLQQRLDDPANAGSTTEQIVADVRGEMEGKYEILASNQLVAEGFQQAINPTVQRYTLAYNAEKEKAARGEMKESLQAGLFRNSLYTTDFSALADLWEENQGSFTPQEQREIIATTALRLADGHNAEQAKEFLNYAAGHFKVGNASMDGRKIKDNDLYGHYTGIISVLKEKIDKLDEAKGDDDEKAAGKIVAGVTSQMYEAGVALKNAGPNGYEVEQGVFLKDEDDLLEYYQEKLQDAAGDNPFVAAQGARDLAVLMGNLKIKPEGVMRFRQIHFNSHTESWQQMMSLPENLLLRNVGAAYEDATGRQRVLLPPAVETKVNALRATLNAERDTLIRTLASGKYVDVNNNPVESSDFQKTVTNDMRRHERELINRWKTGLQDIADQAQRVQEIPKDASQPPANLDNTASLIDPTQKLGEATSATFNPAFNVFDLEQAIRKGEWEKAEEITEQFEDSIRIEKKVGTQFTFNPLRQWTEALTASTTTRPEKERAKKSLLFYLIGTRKNVFTTENIKNGSVNVAVSPGNVVEIPMDTPAVKSVINVVPIISKARIQTIANEQKIDPDADIDVADIKELLNAIYGTKNIPDEDVEKFIEQQKAFYEQQQ